MDINRRIKFILITILLLIFATAFAVIYQSVDKAGNILYSDKAMSGAKKIELKKEQSFTWETLNQEETKSESGLKKTIAETQKYISKEKALAQNQQSESTAINTMKIVSPTKEQYLRDNNGILNISLEIPNADFAGGEKIQVLLDGKPYGDLQTAPFFSIENVERGKHTLKAKLLNNQGATITESNSVDFFMMRTIAKPKPVTTP